jgi:cytochrome c oxidase subunit 2
LAQLTPSSPKIVAPKGLGPGFWTATLVMTIINVILGIAVCYLPLDFLLPAESNPVSNNAAAVDFLFKFMTVFGVAITVYVNGYVIYFAYAYRARADDPPNAIGVPIHHAEKLEIWWTVLPTALLLVLIALSIVVWKQLQFPSGAAALTMEVVGHQFNWEFRYPGLSTGLYSPKYEMHLPAGKQVKILVSSADVIHQFWVPEFRQKISAVPGMVTDLNMTPTVPGTYDISCSEYCGANHSTMQAKMVVDTPENFEKWLAARKTEAAAAPTTLDLKGGDVAAGQKTFEAKCAACHNAAPFDQKKVGPGLAKLTDDPAHPKLVDEKAPTPDNIAGILDKGFTGPIGVMPNRAANGLSDKDIADLVAYLVSLK